jgi:ATP-dependent RNA/DNA helicase IGHMBP2
MDPMKRSFLLACTMLPCVPHGCSTDGAHAGTGKTTALVEAVLQDVKRGSRVLCCSASNIAVDNVVARLASAPQKTAVVRVGHPARLLPEILSSSLEAHVLRSDNSRLAADCRAEIKQLNRRLLKLGRPQYAERKEIRSELRQLAKEEHRRQVKAIEEVMGRAQVVCCTLTGVLSRDVQHKEFDVVYIDEAAQALEVACWGALLRARRAVLAGDHLQLPPTVLSAKAAKMGLAVTLFERLHEMYGESIGQMLKMQYRMHEQIMAWSSNVFYNGHLVAHEAVAQHSVLGLPGVTFRDDVDRDALEAALVLVDTTGCELEERREEHGGSHYNEGEACCVLSIVKTLLAAGVKAEAVGIITPYSAQCSR